MAPATKSVVEKVMEVWRREAKRLTNAEYIDAAEEIACYLEAAAEAAKEEEEEEEEAEEEGG